jgi:hypothetical protein
MDALAKIGPIGSGAITTTPEPMKGGATRLYIDLDEDTRTYSTKKKEMDDELKKMQTEETAFLTENAEKEKDNVIKEVKWKYFITVQLYLYPGDHIPLSAYASLACAKKSNDIYNIWQQIISPKDKNNKPIYKKKMLAYTPVGPIKTVKNKQESREPLTKTIKAKEPEVLQQVAPP